MNIRALSSLCATAVPVAIATAGVVEYHPGLGSLPSAQGWTYSGDGAEGGTVGSSLLTYGPTSNSQLIYWDYDHATSVDFSTDTWAMEARIRLTNTSFGNVSGFRRGGFVMALHDDLGRGIVADLGSNHVSLRNDNNGTSDPVASQDLASVFRTVRLEAGPSGARLLVDGAEVLTHTFGNLATPTASWGEGSILGSTEKTEVASVTLVPAPGVLALAGAGELLAIGRRRR